MIRKKRKKNVFSKIISFKVFIFVAVIVIISLSMGVGGEYYRDYQIQREIDSLQKEIDHFETNNYKLSQLAEYFQTDEYKELEARKRLNMKKDGESVVIIGQLDSDSDELIIEEDDEYKNFPNYIKWWNYFFAS
ncbi:MAG: septum formation initiator family protein [Candidatus Pacebacteria bacterium]|nr:septum formation initiator family protein [Candidatus Paceibacterota bacterium]